MVCSLGMCGLECFGDTTKCDDRCVDTQIDASYCGDCDTSCADDQVCVAGDCVLDCVGGTSLCDDKCVDLMTSTAYCGDCDTSCDGTEVCVDGECERELDVNTKSLSASAHEFADEAVSQ